MGVKAGWRRSLPTWAGLLVGLGAMMMLAKGAILVATGSDRSLVPAFGVLSSLGLAVAALALWRSATRLRSLIAVGGAAALAGMASSLVAFGYLVTGTIPETEDASPAVGGSYVGLTLGVSVSLLLLGIVIAANRSLPGRWRWLPLGLLAAQLPIFIVAGATGDLVGSEDLTDGLGLALTGAAWILLGYGLTLADRTPSPRPARGRPATTAAWTPPRTGRGS